MKNSKGFIKLYRSIVNWEWFSEPIMVKAWVFILTNAAYEPFKFKKINLKRGQYITSERKLARDLDVSKSTARNILLKLKLTNDIVTHIDHQNTVITICKWDYWQSDSENEKPQKRPKSDRKSDQNATEKVTNNTDTNQPIEQPKNNRINSCNIEDCEICNDDRQPLNQPKVDEKMGKRDDREKEEKKERIYISTTTTTPTAKKVVIVDDVVEWLETKSGEIWRDQIAMQLGLRDKSELTELFEFYQRELICHGVEQKDEKDIKSHFINLMRVKQKEERRQNGNNRTNGKQISSEDEKRRRDEEFAKHIAQQLANPAS